VVELGTHRNNMKMSPGFDGRVLRTGPVFFCWLERGAVYKVRRFVYGPRLSLGSGLLAFTGSTGIQRGAPLATIKTPNALPSLRLAEKAKSASPQVLSPRQREILVLIAEGQNTKEIAFTLGISGKTVETHRVLLKGRLSIKNVAGLVSYAVRSGLVSAE